MTAEFAPVSACAAETHYIGPRRTSPEISSPRSRQSFRRFHPGEANAAGHYYISTMKAGVRSINDANGRTPCERTIGQNTRSREIRSLPFMHVRGRGKRPWSSNHAHRRHADHRFRDDRICAGKIEGEGALAFVARQSNDDAEKIRRRRFADDRDTLTGI